MTLKKASLNGPNRARVKQVGGGGDDTNSSFVTLRVRALESLGTTSLQPHLQQDLGDACLMSSKGAASKALRKMHDDSIDVTDVDKNCPLLVHFHDVPVCLLRVMCSDGLRHDVVGEEEDVIYLNKVQRFNHKVCEDTRMKVTYCRNKSYDHLSFVGIEVRGKWDANGGSKSDDDDDDDSMLAKPVSIQSADIARCLYSHTFNSVLTVNEMVVCDVNGTSLVCRVSGVIIDHAAAAERVQSEISASNAAMEDPFRGRVGTNTHFYASVSDGANSAIVVENGRCLPEGKLPDDVIHVTTSDMEWFPVRRPLLAPCINLTKYVQHGRGKYKDEPYPILIHEERSQDAPTDDGCPHCKVPVDCCIFDRVLIFLVSMLYPDERDDFQPYPDEINSLAEAADFLGLQALSDLCASKVSSFDTRVRKDRYIRFSEIEKRNNDQNELLIILDGMVLDITRWLEQHPGGPSIIPTQALNIECSVFFEMYHVSRQSFLYLKSFYIGELDPDDAKMLKSSGEGVSASPAFLKSLRSFTEWRVKIDNSAAMEVHKSF